MGPIEALHRCGGVVNGVVSHRSAAAWWGWELKTQPPRPEVTVPKHRKCDRRRVELHWADLHEDEIRESTFTSRERTLLDCLRTLPLDEALAIEAPSDRTWSMRGGGSYSRPTPSSGTAAGQP